MGFPSIVCLSIKGKGWNKEVWSWRALTIALNLQIYFTLILIIHPVQSNLSKPIMNEDDKNKKKNTFAQIFCWIQLRLVS